MKTFKVAITKSRAGHYHATGLERVGRFWRKASPKFCEPMLSSLERARYAAHLIEERWYNRNTISVESVRTTLVEIGPAHPDYVG